MKNLFLGIAFITSSVSCAQHWETSWKEASAKATKTDHNIVLVFSGSDWCGPCIKLDQNIWQSPEFQKYAETHWILLRADFPRKKANKLSAEQTAQNAKLAEKYNQNGYFPLVVILNCHGKVLGTTGYKNVSADDYIQILKGLES